MDPRLIVPLPPESPWASWARPDIKHCEANLAGWIAAPADTWSNLAYFAAGAWLLRRGTRPAERTLGGVALAIGACSTVFHASYTAAGQALDYAGMFLLTAWLLARAAVRSGWAPRTGPAWTGLFAASAAAYALCWALKLPVQTIMLVHATLVVVLEARLALAGRGGPRAPLAAAVAMIATAYAFWRMDHTDRFCRPDDHLFQWHAAWHLLTAAALVPLARFHAEAA